ncbi:restriction endonuclease subunit S (plasmid) [Tistrella mobilis]|uniref:restriction endonuclease subunit S n=1 Tax=Tistrella mobilis TaxID=171437 RepID=UPI003556D767
MSWPAVTLAEVAEIERKGVASDQIPDGASYLGLEHIESGGVILKKETVKKGDLSSTKFAFTSEHLLYGKLRPYLAKIALPDFDGVCSTDILPIRPGPRLDKRFLAFYLRQPSMVNYAASRAIGANLPRLSPKGLAAFPIPLPPLEEQRRIAEILDQADELRRLRIQALDRLNTLGQAIFHEMFGDVVTNPLGWQSVRLDELCEIGSSKRVFAKEFMSDGVPFYRGTEIGRLASGGRSEPTLFISSDHYERLIKQSGKPEIGDLLLPSICHDGRIWKVDQSDPFYFKDGRVLWIKSGKSEIDSEYLREYLRNLFLRNYASIASGIVFAELKIVNLKKLKIIYPPATLQKEFSLRIAEVEASRFRLMKSRSASVSLFAALQHRAFKGEL